ncbi:MAG: hypothetical protein PHN69_06860 [Candidatus Pacebacteria bacterium]|nr:hypothetical protein [Candidatus Paceibacterota bacterium]
MKDIDQIKNKLILVFSQKHVTSILKYYEDAIKKYQIADWEGVSLKGGKFVESVTKALATYCEVTLPTPRQFRASNTLKSLEQKTNFNDTVRIVIPKACLLIYEITNNRGGRHDSDFINSNAMDTEIIIPTMSWVLAEMFRFSNKNEDTKQAQTLIQSITKRIYPDFESIDGRPYINIPNLKVSDVALLILYYKYNERVSKSDLTDFLKRHGFKPSNISKGIVKISTFIDNENEKLKLRGNGIKRCEEILSKK